MDSSLGRQLYTQLLYGMFTYIGVSSLAGGTLFHPLEGVYNCLLEDESMSFEHAVDVKNFTSELKY